MHRRSFIASMLTATAALAVTRTAVAQPTPAGAIPTPVYLSMATKGGLFLESTARDAYAKTDNPRLRAFTRVEVNEQVNLSGKIAAYTGNAPVPDIMARPGSDPAMTTDAQKQQILGQLSAQQGGPGYDAAFVAASLQGHLEARTIHGSYAQSGEDPGLRRIARGALPLIGQHIALLSRMQGSMGGRG